LIYISIQQIQRYPASSEY